MYGTGAYLRSMTIVLLWFCILRASLPTNAQSVRYQVTLLDAGTEGSMATRINNRGEIIGYFRHSPDGINTPFLYSNGVYTDLRTLDERLMFVNDINDSGQITVGLYVETGIGGRYRGYLLENGTLTDPGMPANQTTTLWSLNNAGQALGVAGDGGWIFPREYYLYDRGTLTNLHNLVGVSGITAQALNDVGAIAGEHADGFYLYSEGQFDSLGRPESGASLGIWDMNNHSQLIAVGLRPFSHDYLQSFLYTNNEWRNLGGLTLSPFQTVFAQALNDDGQVVGYVESEFGLTAFLYSQGMLYNLNTLLEPMTNSGWQLHFAYDINAQGQIVGSGLYQGREQAFLLTPSSVPEPGSLLMAGSLLLMLTVRFGSRKRSVRR